MTIIISDLRNVFLRALAITLLLFLAFYGLGNISSCCSRATILSYLSILFSLVSYFFLFLPDFFLNLFGLGFLVDLVILS